MGTAVDRSVVSLTLGVAVDSSVMSATNNVVAIEPFGVGERPVMVLRGA